LENGTDGKWQLPFVCCKRKTEAENLPFFDANGNGNRKFVFIGLETVNGNRRLLFQQTYPTMYVYIYAAVSKKNGSPSDFP
jgi:hypothetical protein